MATTAARSRLIRDEHELGSWERVVRSPDPRLSGVFYRDLLGFVQRGASFSSWLESPRPAFTLMIDLDGGIELNGMPLPGDWVAGLNDQYAVVGFGPRYASVDLELTPLGAYAVLGRPLGELQGETVALRDVFGDDGRRLVETLREEPDWDVRFDLIEEFVGRRIAEGPRADPAVAWALQRLADSDGRARIGALAAELGCSRRYLHARFREQVGLPPKTLARLFRFAAVRSRIARAPARWADIAAECGFSDQAHLVREFRDLAGTTPTDFVTRLLPGYGGVVGDGLPFVQDRGGP